MKLFRIVGLSLVLLAMASPCRAEIRPDTTLPTPSQTRRDRETTVITGGTRSGRNLFHSFERFSIPNRQTAAFRVDSDVAHVFSRVTGGSISRINGLLEVLDSSGAVSQADFYLINPNGILFGRNAALNVGGAFLATTASQIRFQDNLTFSAVNPPRSELLSISVPIGLRFDAAPNGLIRNQSQSNLVLDQFGDPVAGGLQVEPGETLALVGGSVEVAGGFLTAAGGRIELGSVRTGEVRLNSGELGYGNARLGPMQFSDLATVNASGDTGGTIRLRADQIDLIGSSLLVSDTGTGNGGDITIRADQLNLTDFSLVTLSATGSGRGGSLRVAVRQLTAAAGSQLSTRALDTGDAGNLSVTAAQQVSLSGRDSVLASGDFSPTGLFSQTAIGSSGRGGTLSVTTPSLQLFDGASIATDTSGQGQAGDLQIAAETIELAGILRKPNGAPLLRQGLPLPGGLFADSNDSATGEGGAIQIDTARLNLRDGAVVQTNAEGAGGAGRLTVRATEQIAISGVAGPDLPPTAIFAASGGLPGQGGGGTSTATGRGGTLRLITPDLQVSDRAVIAVGSLNPNEAALGAGNLRIEADRVQLNRGRLVAETNSGDGGNIDLQVRDSLVLRQNSRISTSAGIEDRGGNGGNIAVDTGFVIAPAIENSDISANAFTGNGGNVTIAAQGILGIQQRDRPTNQSDITASSEFGTPGQIVIRSPDVDPEAAVPELAATPLSDRPAQGCAANAATTAEFFTTGRSGLPLSPYEPLSNSDVLADLRLPGQTRSTPLVEAQGWYTNDKGAVVLSAAAPQMGCRLTAGG